MSVLRSVTQSDQYTRSMDAGLSQSPEPGSPVCVIWHEGEGDPPPALGRALSKRGIQLHRASDGYAAFAQVCRLHRDSGTDVVILLLVEPDRMGSAGRVLDALESYTPRAVAWMYADADDPKLRAIEAEDAVRWRSDRGPADPFDAGMLSGPLDEGSESGGGLELGGPPLRYVPGEGESGPGGGPDDLSDDELEALLGDEDD